MKKSLKILLFGIAILGILILVLQLFQNVNNELKSKITAFAVQKDLFGEEGSGDIVENTLTNVTDYINKNPKYLQFIKDSYYHSAEIIINKQRYYLEYNPDENRIIERGKMDTDFTMKISNRRFEKMYELFEFKYYQEAAMYLMRELPRKVKISLFRQCMKTDWCSQFNF